jgi:hypothetical protein
MTVVTTWLIMVTDVTTTGTVKVTVVTVVMIAEMALLTTVETVAPIAEDIRQDVVFPRKEGVMVALFPPRMKM